MRSTVCHNVGIDEQNPELGRALQHVGVCDCVRELQLDRIQRQNITFQRRR